MGKESQSRKEGETVNLEDKAGNPAGRETIEVRGKNPLLGLVMAWLVPGAGQWYLGQKGKAVYYFALITFTFFLGTALAKFCNVNIERFPWHYAGEIFYGSATLVVQHLTQDLKINEFNRFLDYGTLVTTVAGLLNVVVMVDYFETWAKNR
jgi:hypothetical protein